MSTLSLSDFIASLSENPCQVTFEHSIKIIEQHYIFTPTEFSNGEAINLAGQNNGSCKIFAFAHRHQLNPSQTLNLFGEFYHQDVLLKPEGDDHKNIRNFIKFGWQGITFKSNALVPNP